MIRFGVPPYLECSSRGDVRFSAFYANILRMGNRSIEEIYQAAKEFPGGVTGLSWREAKGKRCLNQGEVRVLYARLWDLYIEENPHLLAVLKAASGVSDRFGQVGRACQAEELWRIRSQS